MLHGIKAVIFDLDGTLIDSLGIWNAVDLALAQYLGHPEYAGPMLAKFRDDALARHSLEPNPYVGFCADFGALCGSPLSGEAIHKERYRISRELIRTDVHLKPSADIFVKALKARGYRLAIGTTTKRANIDIYGSTNPHIAPKLSFDELFDVILTRENVTKIKPDPEVYLTAAERLGVSPDTCLVFEDSRQGLLAAKAAGMRVAVMQDDWSNDDRDFLKAATPYHFGTWQEAINRL